MWTEHSSPAFLLLVVASIAAHLVLVAVLPSAAPTPTTPRPKTYVTIETVHTPAPATPAPEIEPLAEAVPVRSSSPRAPRAVAARRAVARAAATEPTPPAETPVDFSGTTLSNESSSWSSPLGNGERMTGPIVAVPAAHSAGHVAAGAEPGERVVAVGDLSRPPRAPDLDGALAANYPADARRAGTTGKAVVRARILADGSVGAVRVVSETAPGFGDACRRTITGSRWQAPLDTNREPVITDINYTCTFAVAR